MRLAIISDVHANLEAFQAVLKEIDKVGVDKIYHLGDIVGYNANPNECVDILRERVRKIRGVVVPSDQLYAILSASAFQPWQRRYRARQ